MMTNMEADPSQPILIGITGASGSGKTTIARALLEELGADKATLLSLDEYYKDLSHLDADARNQTNFDEPAAIEHVLLCKNLYHLKQGETVPIPQYDFSTHTRKATPYALTLSRYLILEGIFTLTYPTVRDQLDLKVYVKCPEVICLNRRLKRDICERGRSEASVLQQYQTTVLPAFKTHIEPQKDFADLCLDGTDRPERGIEQILQTLENIQH